MEDLEKNELLLPEDKLSTDFLNQYLSETVDILKNQIEKLNLSKNNRSHIFDVSQSENVTNNDYFELQIELIQKLNNSLKLEVESLIKKDNEISILKILCQRNNLLNKLMIVLFEKCNDLMEREQKLINNKLKHYHSKGKYQKDINTSYQDILAVHKNYGIKVPYTGLKHEQMIYYNNSLKNRKYGNNRSCSVEHFYPNTSRKLFFERNNDLSKSNRICKYENKNEKLNNNLKEGNLSSYRNIHTKNRNKYKFIKKTKPKCCNTKRSASIIKTFKENNDFKENKPKMINRRKNRNSNCLFDWEKLNLDKLNEISSLIVDKKKNKKKIN